MKISKYSSIIDEITAIGEIYSDYGCIYISLKNRNYNEIKFYKEQLIQLAARVGITLKDFTLMPPQITSRNIDKYRELVDLLFHSNFIGAQDRSEIENEIREIETNLLERKHVVKEKHSTSQEDVLRMMVEPYIEALVEKANSFEDIIPTLIYAIHDPSSKQAGWKKWFSDKYPNIEDNLVDELADCVSAFAKIIQGKVNLISAFKQTGLGIPSLQDQRKILIDIFRQMVSEKFPKYTSNFKTFYLEMAFLNLKAGLRVGCRIDDKFKIDDITGFPIEKHIIPTMMFGMSSKVIYTRAYDIPIYA